MGKVRARGPVRRGGLRQRRQGQRAAQRACAAQGRPQERHEHATSHAAASPLGQTEGATQAALHGRKHLPQSERAHNVSVRVRVGQALPWPGFNVWQKHAETPGGQAQASGDTLTAPAPKVQDLGSIKQARQLSGPAGCPAGHYTAS